MKNKNNNYIQFKNSVLFSFLLVALSSCLREKIDDDVSPKTPKVEEYNYVAVADSVQQSTYSNFLSSTGHYFTQNNIGNSRFHYWWNAHMVDLLVDGYLRTDDQKYKDRIKVLVAGIKATNESGTYINDYYDDMEWLALSSLRAYNATQDQEYLDIANLLWSDIQTGMNMNQGGGIAWRKSQTDYKNTPANAPAIILACRLFRQNKAEANLEKAKTLYTWLISTLIDNSTGVAWDGINRQNDGQIDKWYFTYNQGVFIGAALELYKTTGELSYLNDAVRNADYITNDSQLFPGGIAKDEGLEDGGLFKGILIRYLALLAREPAVSQTKREKYIGVITFNAKTLSAKGIKRPTMLIGSDWTKAPSAGTDLSIQLSGAMLLEAAASFQKEGKLK